ncbi:hypothetical protein [Arthrobacter sp. 9AX]|uniref:hypothetical protein n=1 Tax=Arthrobacter sp. 9AX TaxID=2653131 RepID=UPI001358BCC3|nr:hypothetical protein [Arthrobacter sp. 9AX]
MAEPYAATGSVQGVPCFTDLACGNGIVGVGVGRTGQSYTGVQVDRGQAEQQHVSGVRV